MMKIDSELISVLNIPTHMDAASLPGGIFSSSLHVIDLQLHSGSQYSNDYYNLYVLWIRILQDDDYFLVLLTFNNFVSYNSILPRFKRKKYIIKYLISLLLLSLSKITYFFIIIIVITPLVYHLKKCICIVISLKRKVD